jgi:hypothetical protein
VNIQEWREQCKKRFQAVTKSDDDEFLEQCVNGCVEMEKESEGDNVEDWSDPDDAADMEMSYWDDGDA